jgi:hypothetical protein
VFASYQQHISDTSLTLFRLWREFIMFLRTLPAEEEPDKTPLFVVVIVGRSLPLAIVLIFKSPWNLELNVIGCPGFADGELVWVEYLSLAETVAPTRLIYQGLPLKSHTTIEPTKFHFRLWTGAVAALT